MTPNFRIFVLFPIVFGLMASFFLVIGLRGWITNKPFVISSRWLLVLVLLGVSPGMFQSIGLSRPAVEPGGLVALHLLLPIMLIVILIFALLRPPRLHGVRYYRRLLPGSIAVLLEEARFTL